MISGLAMRPLVASIAIAAAAVIVSTAGADESMQSDQQRRPNFIVIQPDDHLFLEEWNPPGRFLTLDYGLTGEFSISPSSSASSASSLPYISPVPNINRIRNNGLQMTNAYAASTMCGTSRYSSLTGRLPSRSSYGRHIDKDIIERSLLLGDTIPFHRDVIIPKTKLEDVTGVDDPKDCTSNNLAAVLQHHGYSTGVVGKWHLESSTILEDESLYWDYKGVQENVKRCGFDFAEAIYRENLGGDHNYNVDGYPVTHNMEHVTAEAIRFIHEAVGASLPGDKENDDEDEETNTSKPFFLYFNPTVPHSSGDVTDALLNANCKDTVQGRLPNAPYIPYGMTAGIDAGGNAGCREYRKSVLDRASAAAATMGDAGADDDDDKLAGAVWVDDAIGSLFETLEALNILESTLILFQLDHGVDAKGSLFEGGSRIVQFVHYPDRIQVGKSPTPFQDDENRGWDFRGLVSTIDIAPTLMDLAGVPRKDTNNEPDPSLHRYDMDGRSWFSDVVASNTHVGEHSNGGIESSEPKKAQKKAQKRLTKDNYFTERCLFVEEGMDRSVRCGCHKYIYIFDVNHGFTVREAEKEGIRLETHNFYNLCDDITGNYINAPERSPELRYPSDSKQSPIQDNDLKTKLKNKIACLLRQTDPVRKHIDYETDCGRPLYQKNTLGSSAVEEEDSSSDVVVDTKMPTEPPDTNSTTLPGTNESTTVDVDVVDNNPEQSGIGVNDLEKGKFLGTKKPIATNTASMNNNMTKPISSEEDGAAPFIRLPASQPSTALAGSTIPTYAMIAVAFILIVAPCIIYWSYREYCRKVVVRGKAKRYRTSFEDCTDDSDASFKEIEQQLVEVAITTNYTRTEDLEVGSAWIEKTRVRRTYKYFTPLCAKLFQSAIWQKIADEARWQALLRAKWCVYTVSGVVLGSSSSHTDLTAGTALTSAAIEAGPSGSTSLESIDDQSSDGGEETNRATDPEAVLPNPDETSVSSLTEDDGDSTIKEEGNTEDAPNAEIGSGSDPSADEMNGETDHSSDNDDNSMVEEETNTEEFLDSNPAFTNGGTNKEVPNEECNEKAKVEVILGNYSDGE